MQFYTYRILGEQGEVLYIGKGTGNRLARQQRRFRAKGEVIERYASERAAYRHERALIAQHAPPLNKSPGGTGGKFGRSGGGMSEAALFHNAAHLLRRISGMSLAARRPFERMTYQIANSLGLDRFKSELSKLGVTVDFVDEIPLKAGT